jgi:hypothetical protein
LTVNRIKRASKEKAVEAELRRQVLERGGMCEKVVALGRRGFPDRLCIGPRGIMFVEVKRPRGGRLSPNQIKCHAALAALGVAIDIVRDSADIDRLVRRLFSRAHKK